MPNHLLHRLTDTERQVLRLLAEGHTIKSAAGVIGSTQAALNERLREARRKTGMGSSRELARDLKAQENRDDLIEVEEENDKPSSDAPSDSSSWRPGIGVTIMTIAAMALIAGAFALTSQPSSNTRDDPLIGRALPDGASPAELHTQLRAESRDTVWAPKAEATLRARYETIPNVGTVDNELRIRCGTTICEVAGTLPSVSSNRGRMGMEKEQLDATVRRLQQKLFFEELRDQGLAFETFLLASTESEPRRPVFFSYFIRKKG